VRKTFKGETFHHDPKIVGRKTMPYLSNVICKTNNLSK